MRGADFTVIYESPVWRSGRWNVLWRGSYLDESVSAIDPAITPFREPDIRNAAGTNPGYFALPRWRSNLDLTWQYATWEAVWSIRYLHQQRVENSFDVATYDTPGRFPYLRLHIDF